MQAGGTLITLGAASGFTIENFAVPVRDLKRGLTRNQHFARGTILNIEVDTTHPVGYGMAAETFSTGTTRCVPIRNLAVRCRRYTSPLTASTT